MAMKSPLTLRHKATASSHTSARTISNGRQISRSAVFILKLSKLVKDAFRFDVGSMGLFRRTIRADENSCYPLPISATRDSKKSGLAFLVRSTQILGILPMRSFPQITERVVQAVTVYVIYELLRPLSRDVKPCEPRSKVSPSIHRH